jgi:hypothetical protein
MTIINQKVNFLTLGCTNSGRLVFLKKISKNRLKNYYHIFYGIFKGLEV